MEITVSSLLAEVPDLAGHQVRRLLQAAAGVEASWMVGDPPVGPDVAARFRGFVERRRRGEPLQYIEGTVQFGPVELKADPRALIPRPETERLWELSVELIQRIDTPVILDLCTGSGNLALACKYARPDAEVIGVDVSVAALDLARENATYAELEVEFIESDLFESIAGRYRGRIDLIVSNPPYIGAGEVADLPAEVRDHEPHGALVPGPAGTEILARIAAEAGEWLRVGGYVACEIGETQADECRALFAAFEPRVELDLSGRPRFIVGCTPERPDVH